MISVMSFGGGVQSTAMLVLAARGEIDYRTALFCNVGADSENPATLEYVEKWSRPYAEDKGIAFHELHKRLKDGTVDTVRSRIERPGASIGIPVRMSNGAPASRSCTVDFKVLQVAKWLKAHGATPDDPATVALGISLDEFHRMKKATTPWQVNAWPLIDLEITRQDCLNIIEAEGLPEPPKSSCYFCPFHTKAAWREMARKEPELFAKSVELERFINARQDENGKDRVWMSSALRPLDEAFSDDGQMSLFDDDTNGTCDIGGYCMS